MKNVLIIFLFSISFCLKAQDTLYTYFDSDWEEVSAENAVYSRKAFQNEEKKWAVIDRFKDGQVQMTGVYKSKKLKKKNGLFTYFYPNGQKKTQKNFLKDKMVGASTSWYESGNIEQKGSYDRKGNKTGDWKFWYENGNIDSEGGYQKDERVNSWKWYFENGQLSADESYTDGELVDFQFWNEDGSRVEGEVEALQMPEYVGGMDRLGMYLQENVNYPEMARLSNVQGKVHVNFIVDKNGAVTESKIIKSRHPLLDQEALRVVKEMPNWIPGKQHNRPIRVAYNLPVVFSLR